MKPVAKTEDNLVLEIPAVVGVGIVRVQPSLAIIVPIDVEDVRIAIRVGIVHMPICTTTPQMLLGLNLIRYLK